MSRMFYERSVSIFEYSAMFYQVLKMLYTHSDHDLDKHRSIEATY